MRQTHNRNARFFLCLQCDRGQWQPVGSVNCPSCGGVLEERQPLLLALRDGEKKLLNFIAHDGGVKLELAASSIMKPIRYITIPNGNRVSIGAYVAAWRKLLTIDPETQINDWQWFPVTARDVLADISYGVNDRINKRARS